MQNEHIGVRESVKDTAKVLGALSDFIIARVFSHKTLKDLAANSNAHVINALCNLYHPCQALADFLSIKELLGEEAFSSPKRVKLAYIGDGNNVAHSLMLGTALLGQELAIICPAGRSPDAQLALFAMELAAKHGGKISISSDKRELEGASLLYTDTWISLGDECSKEEAKAYFAGFEVSSALLDSYKIEHFFHCLPAYEGMEIESGLLHGSKSRVFLQAKNRLWAQAALLLALDRAL